MIIRLAFTDSWTVSLLVCCCIGELCLCLDNRLLLVLFGLYFVPFPSHLNYCIPNCTMPFQYITGWIRAFILFVFFPQKPLDDKSPISQLRQILNVYGQKNPQGGTQIPPTECLSELQCECIRSEIIPIRVKLNSNQSSISRDTSLFQTSFYLGNAARFSVLHEDQATSTSLAATEVVNFLERLVLLIGEFEQRSCCVLLNDYLT